MIVEVVINVEAESQSKYGIAHALSKTWFWKDNLNHKGYLRATGEMEALDRLEEVLKVRGTLSWITGEEYVTLK